MVSMVTLDDILVSLAFLSVLYRGKKEKKYGQSFVDDRAELFPVLLSMVIVNLHGSKTHSRKQTSQLSLVMALYCIVLYCTVLYITL